MALTQIPIELSSTTGIVDNSTGTAITIDASGNVDVTGTVAADGLTVTAAAPSIQMTDSDNNADAYIQATDGNIRFYADDNNEAANSIITFNIDGSEAMRIDSAGQVNLKQETSNTTTRSDQLRIEAQSSGTTGVGFGSNIYFVGERNGGTLQAMGRIGFGANTNTVTDLSSDFIVETSKAGVTSESMRIDSAGNTTFKANNSSVGPIVTLENTATAVNGQAWGSIHFDSNDLSTGASGTRASIVGTSTSFNGDGNLDFYTAPSNGTNTFAARIDSSGNLLVGTTDNSLYNTTTETGVQIDGANGNVAIARTSNKCLNLNRLSTDGDMLEFRKDGATVGSIASTDGTDLQIGSGNCYLRFDDATNQILPTNAAGTKRDATFDLGDSDARYKDLYLSGGAYLGGTAAGNKLDYYEEGTWTPTFTNLGTVTLLVARYTRIGNACTIYLSFTCTSTPTLNSSLFTLPFTSAGITSGTFTRSTFEGGFIEAQSSNTNCYFASTASTNVGSFYCNITFETT